MAVQAHKQITGGEKKDIPSLLAQQLYKYKHDTETEVFPCLLNLL